MLKKIRRATTVYTKALSRIVIFHSSVKESKQKLYRKKYTSLAVDAEAKFSRTHSCEHESIKQGGASATSSI